MINELYNGNSGLIEGYTVHDEANNIHLISEYCCAQEEAIEEVFVRGEAYDGSPRVEESPELDSVGHTHTHTS